MRRYAFHAVMFVLLALLILPTAALATSMPSSADVMDGQFGVLPNGLNTDRPLGIAVSAPVQASYFDDAVFIGDSVTLKLKFYVMDESHPRSTTLGQAQFLTAGSLGSGEAMQPVTDKSLHPTYQGQKMRLEDAVARMGAKKVYIMLGMNDVAVYGTTGAAENLMTLVGLIREKSPDAKIMIQTATPRISSKTTRPTTASLFEYDLELYRLYRQMRLENVYLLDVAYVMRDEYGYLPDAYCSDPEDMGLHFSDEACVQWIRFLYTHTPKE